MVAAVLQNDACDDDNDYYYDDTTTITTTTITATTTPKLNPYGKLISMSPGPCNHPVKLMFDQLLFGHPWAQISPDKARSARISPDLQISVDRLRSARIRPDQARSAP